VILAWVLGGCQPAPPALPFDRPRAPVIERLLELPAELDLSSGTLPPDLDTTGRFRLEGFERVEGLGWDEMPAWSTPLPVRLPKRSYFAQPDGLEVHRALQVLPFTNLPGPWSSGSWDVKEGHVVVAWPDDPNDEHFELVSTGSAETWARRDLRRSGLSEDAFVRLDATLQRETRPSLLLPAPSSATWRVDLPEQASLRFGVGLLRPLLEDAEPSDGASVVLRVDGVEVSRVTASVGTWTDVVVDLSSQAGSRTVSLESEPDGSPLYDHVVVSDPQVRSRSAHEPRRVVLVGVDTLRWDAVTQHGYERDTTAPLDPLAAESVLFSDAYTPAPRTRPSFRTALTGRWPLAAIGAKTLGERMREAGFATAGIVANVHLVPRFGFHEGYGLWRMDSDQEADDQVDRGLRWLTANRDTDSLLFLHLIDPHVFYRAPAAYDGRYEAGAKGPLQVELNRWDLEAMDANKLLGEEHRAWLRARYDGEVRFAAEGIARLFEGIEQLPGDTLVVLFSDHGEEFWDHGGYEHNHTLYQELVKGTLWIRPPGGVDGPLTVGTPASLADIVPTVLDLVSLPTEGLDGQSLAATWQEPHQAWTDRALPLGHVGYARETWGVVQAGHKYLLRTWDGHEELFDLRADPGEQHDLSGSADLGRWRVALGEATGWAVGTGWRLHLRYLAEPAELHFAEPIDDAWLVDPEAGEERRANEAWGERPKRLPDDVARVTLSEDRRVVRVEPGPMLSDAVVAMRFSSAPDASLSVGDVRVVLDPAGQLVAPSPALLGRLEPGAVIGPVEGVRAHLDPSWGSAPADQLEELKAMGYVE